ncbi:ABC transporter ATP-binding protein [bacterium LRH843]|nr:ABC transporter ATP-binding protein [bacterium LRH843]
MDKTKETSTKAPLLEVRDLSVSFTGYTKGLRQRSVEVISGLNLTISCGEIVAVVGASGSGKSLLASSILGILPENASMKGEILYNGEELTLEKQFNLRGKEITLIPQTVNSLDPLMKTGKQVQASVKIGNKKETQREVFNKVHLETEVENLYPFQISGGMARRVLAATAMVSSSQLVIADEPTPGLDEKVLNETVNHLRRLADEGRGIMFITHDIMTALKVADRVAVFYAGTTIEIANVSDFSGRGEHLRHPYTKALWRALPQNDFIPIEGSQPLAAELPAGCLFEPRCPHATSLCKEIRPDFNHVRKGYVRCFHA